MKYRSNILSNSKYYALGEARLERVGNYVKLSNLTNSGLDGILIDVEGADEFELNFTPFEIKEGNSFNISHIGIDEWGRLKTIGQQTMYFNPSTKQVEIAMNSKLMSKEGLILHALQDDDVVFQGRYPHPTHDPRINWWPVVWAAVIVVSTVDYEYDRTNNSDSSWTSKHHFSVGNKDGRNKYGGKDGCIVYTNLDKIKFEANKLLFGLQETFTKDIPLVKMKAVQITASNYSELEIIGGKITMS